ncbi:LOW QUALITY PROTEIN: glutathione hydrolase-like YwrD proenzyme [Pangshura tecta]
MEDGEMVHKRISSNELNGGNTVDAAVAIAAALNFTEPCSTGIGLACICLCYDANTKKVQGLSGGTVLSTTASLHKAVSLHGSKKLSMGQILQPASKLAEKCFPVSEITAYHWKCGAHVLQARGNKPGKELPIHGYAPHHGQGFCNPFLANTFDIKEILSTLCATTLSGADKIKKRFYEGCVAEAIIETVQKNGGIMDLEDLKSHVTNEVKPIYKDVNVWEIPPNGQGITALIALHILDHFNIKDMGYNTADYLHVLIEALKLSSSVTFWFCADRDKVPVPTTYTKGCLEVVNLQRASDKYNGNLLPVGSDTVYFTVVDAQGNASSFINSNYMGFGIGLEPGGCGFTLQNRGSSFSLSPSHLNCLALRKWLHMIIPALAAAADTGDLLCSFGVMGGFKDKCRI